MSNVKRGLAAAIVTALLALPLIPAAQAHDGALARKDTYARTAKTKNPPTPSWTSWPEGAPDYHGSNGG